MVMANIGHPTLRVAIWRGSLRQRNHCPQGEGCWNKHKFIVPQRREEAEPPQQHWLPVRPMPIDRHMPNNNSAPSQPTPIQLQLIFTQGPIANALPLLPFDHLPLLPFEKQSLLPTDNLPLLQTDNLPLLQIDNLSLLQCSQWRGTQMQLE